jgi:hemolysin activation/secretion protein
MFILANSLIALPLQAKEINLLKPAKVQDPSVSNNTERTKKNTINDTEKEISFIPIPEFLLTISSNSDSLSLNERLIVADRRNLSTEIAQPSSASSSSLIEKEKDDSVPLKLSVEENSSFQTNDFDLNTNKPETAFNQIPESITVKNFEIVGSSIFTEEELKKVTTPFTNRPLSFGELFQARSAITKLYTDRGYVNSGAYIPPQELEDGQVTIEVLEGELEEINITGTNRLDADYIRSRLLKAGKKPVNVDSLLEALQLLRLDPLIDNVSAELSAGIRPGKSHLDIQITEADPFTMFARLDNSRSPSVGTDRRSFGFIHSNLLGFGDRLEAGYTNTDGSYGFDFAYSLPMNASDGKLRFAFGVNSNDVIEEPFNPLDIESKSRYYELNFRQPLILKPGKELAFGIAFSRQESETSLLNIPFALSRGADEEGDTRISAINVSSKNSKKSRRKSW